MDVLGHGDEWDVLEEIPNDSAPALVLIEHHWAVPLRDAVARAGGVRLGDAFISPLDLVEIGSCRPRTPRSCTPSRPPQGAERMFASRRVARRTSRRVARRRR